MRLSDLPAELGLNIVRDAEFKNLGLLFDDLEEKLVFAERPQAVTAITRARGVCSILCPPDFAPRFSGYKGLAMARDPRISFFDIQKFLVERTEFYAAPFATEIAGSARVHPRAWIDERNVRIGPDTIIEANVVVERGTTIGSRVHIRAGAVIGSEGFQTAGRETRVLQMAHGGGVSVADDVHVFANATIARAVFRQATTIGEFSMIGNGAFVSHNVRIGKRCLIGHNAVVNGNTVIDDDAVDRPQRDDREPVAHRTLGKGDAGRYRDRFAARGGARHRNDGHPAPPDAASSRLVRLIRPLKALARSLAILFRRRNARPGRWP